MRSHLPKFAGSVLVAAAIGSILLVNAGDLNPPAGPVAPTMKTLVEVEPRTNVQTLPSAGDAVFVISQPGSYYLTANVVGESGKNGIKITSNDVTLDLGGFSVQGVPGSGTGIWVENVHRSVAVRNGVVADWGFHGIDFGSAHNSIIEGIRATDNSSDGITAWYNCAVKDCVCEENDGRGFTLNNSCAVTHCTAVLNSGDGFNYWNSASLNNCIAESNEGRGFNGTVYGEGIDESDNCTLINCVASFNGEQGFFGGDANTLTNCTARSNGYNGISMRDHATVTGCSMSGNGFADVGYAGIEAWYNVLIADSTANNNSGNGIYINTGVVANCTASANFYNGIEVFIGSVSITGTHASYNLRNGMLLKESCKVENCTTSFNDLNGILADPRADPVAKACQIRNCYASRNFNDGIGVISNSVVEGSHCEENGSLGRLGGDGAGITATGGRNRIDGNHVVRNDRGIEVSSTSSTILRNSASGNTDDYGSIVGGNDTAPIGTAAASTSPWANLAF